MHDLQREIHNPHPLMYRARRQDIDIIAHILADIRLIQPPTNLDQEFPAQLIRRTPPFRLQVSSRDFHPLGREIVEHDYIRAGGDGSVGLGLGLTFHLDFDAEARSGFRSSDGCRDGQGGFVLFFFAAGSRVVDF